MRRTVPVLVERWGDSLYRAAFAVCRNPQDAEDVVQETLLAYYRSDKEFDSDEHIRAWLIRVAVNKARPGAHRPPGPGDPGRADLRGRG